MLLLIIELINVIMILRSIAYMFLFNSIYIYIYIYIYILFHLIDTCIGDRLYIYVYKRIYTARVPFRKAIFARFWSSIFRAALRALNLKRAPSKKRQHEARKTHKDPIWKIPGIQCQQKKHLPVWYNIGIPKRGMQGRSNKFTGKTGPRVLWGRAGRSATATGISSKNGHHHWRP